MSITVRILRYRRGFLPLFDKGRAARGIILAAPTSTAKEVFYGTDFQAQAQSGKSRPAQAR
jgi:hypothetical protein